MGKTQWGKKIDRWAGDVKVDREDEVGRREVNSWFEKEEVNLCLWILEPYRWDSVLYNALCRVPEEDEEEQKSGGGQRQCRNQKPSEERRGGKLLMRMTMVLSWRPMIVRRREVRGQG